MSFTRDAAAVLAALLDEPGGNFVTANLRGAEISSVNLSEVYATLIDYGHSFESADDIIKPLPIRIRTYRDAHAWQTAKLRPLTKSLGLSLGDRACLTQSIMNRLPILTGDRRIAQADTITGVEITLIR